MTIDAAVRALRDAGIEDALREALLLAGHFTGTPSALLLAERGRDIDDPAFDAAVRERLGHKPLQYILGSWAFCGLTFRVTPDCLIPRPDTEVIAARAADLLPPGGRFADLCAGSGCIAAAVLALTGEKDVSGYAVELSPAAADMARDNLRRLGYLDRCPVVVGDARDDLFPDEAFDLIVSNPPYIAADEMDGLAPELSFEPRMALTDDADGLTLIRAIVKTWKGRLAPGGHIVLEHGWRQGEAVRNIAAREGFDAEPIFDYSGRERGEVLSRRAARIETE